VLGQVSERKPADPLNYGAALLLPLGLLGDAVNLVTLPLGFSLI
jgi:hypothetical protein